MVAYPQTVTITSFLAQPAPRLIAHRGLAQVAPENTLVAYRAAMAAMASSGQVPAVKTDVYLLSDGSLGVMHDSTVDRTTTSTGPVTNYTAQSWKTLVSNTSIVGPAWSSDGWGATSLADLLSDLGGKAVIFIECKNSNSTAVNAAIALIKDRGLQSSCVLVGEDTTLLLPALAKAAGIGWWYYWLANPISGPVTPAQAANTPGVTGLGACCNQGNSYSDADVTSIVSAAHSAGLPANGFTYIRQYDYARGVSFGIDVHVVNDLWVATTAAYRTTDAFSVGAPVPGEPGNITLASGSVSSPGYSFLGSAGFYRRNMTPAMGLGGVYEVLGFMCPKAGFGSSSVYTVTGIMFWDVAETSTATGAQWGAIEVGAPDDRKYTANDGPAYTCAIRQGNGSTFAVPTLQVFKQVPGAYQGNGSYASGSGTQVGSNKGSTTGFAAPNTLGAQLNAGAQTALTLGSAVTIPAGMRIALANGQIATVASPVTASTAVTISSLTVASVQANGSAVSFGIPFTVKVDYSVANQVTITFTRTDTGDQLVATDTNTAGVGPYVGGYVHIGKAGTGSAGSTLALSFAGLSMS